jgi:hypothetical protein
VVRPSPAQDVDILATPGYFTKDFMGGREELLRVLKKARYKEAMRPVCANGISQSQKTSFNMSPQEVQHAPRF